MTTTGLYCPNCGQLDSVRKVSSIVSDGTSSSTYSGYGDGIGYYSGGMVVMDEIITVRGSSQSQLSQMLSPPSEPRYISFTTMLKRPYGVFCIFLGLFGLIMLPIVWFLGLAFILGPTIVFLDWASASEKEKSLIVTEMPRWKNAISKWWQLYYCYRCDIVYIPGQNIIVPVHRMMDFLYH